MNIVLDTKALAEEIADILLERMSGTPAQEVLDTKGAAALLQLGEDAVLALARAGEIPCVRLGAKLWRYSRRALIAHCASTQIQPPAD